MGLNGSRYAALWLRLSRYLAGDGAEDGDELRAAIGQARGALQFGLDSNASSEELEVMARAVSAAAEEPKPDRELRLVYDADRDGEGD
jgi:hypothetical protein